MYLTTLVSTASGSTADVSRTRGISIEYVEARNQIQDTLTADYYPEETRNREQGTGSGSGIGLGSGSCARNRGKRARDRVQRTEEPFLYGPTLSLLYRKRVP